MERGEIRFHQKRRNHGGENRVASARDMRKYCQMLRRKCCSEKIGLVREYWRVSAGCCCLVQGAEQLQSGQPLGMRSLRATAHCTLHEHCTLHTACCTLHTLQTISLKLYFICNALHQPLITPFPVLLYYLTPNVRVLASVMVIW